MPTFLMSSITPAEALLREATLAGFAFSGSDKNSTLIVNALNFMDICLVVKHNGRCENLDHQVVYKNKRATERGDCSL